MAGTSGSSSALKATILLTAGRTAPSLRLSHSKFFASHLDFSQLYLSLSSRTSSAIKARGGYSPYYKGRRSQSESEEEEDSALDMSTLRSPTVRLIDKDQNMVGVVSVREAQQMAESAELDLVIISPEADPPVVKIMDYEKHRYDQQKRKRDQQKKTTATRVDLKELKMGYNIETHDYDVRLRAAKKFLNEGHKVKMIVSLKGRENIFKKDAIQLIKRFQSDVGELATVEAKNFNDRNMFMILIPNKAVTQKSREPTKKEVVAEAKPEVAEAKPEVVEVKPDVTQVSAGV